MVSSRKFRTHNRDDLLSGDLVTGTIRPTISAHQYDKGKIDFCGDQLATQQESIAEKLSTSYFCQSIGFFVSSTRTQCSFCSEKSLRQKDSKRILKRGSIVRGNLSRVPCDARTETCFGGRDATNWKQPTSPNAIGKLEGGSNFPTAPS